MSASPLVEPQDQTGMLQALQDRLTVLEQTAIVPVGLIAYCRGPVPNGWLWTDGSAFDTARYGQLAAHLGGGTLPDLGGRVAVGLEAAGTFAVVGLTGGVETVTLTAAQSGLPAHSTNGEAAHTHVIAAGALTGDFTLSSQVAGGPSGSPAGQGTGSPYALNRAGVTNAGSSHVHTVTAAAASASHTNLQPYIVLTPIIKV